MDELDSLFQQAVKAIELIDIYPNQCACIREQDFGEDSDLSNISRETNLNLRAEIMEPIDSSVETTELLRSFVSFGARYVEIKDEEKVNVCAEVTAEFVAIYRVKVKIPDEAIQEFIKRNVVHNVWPFWREHLLRTTINARLPKFVVPLHKSISLESADTSMEE